MAALEAKLQKKLKLPQGLIERSKSSAPSSVRKKTVRRSTR
jgi:hypothetical protein